MHGERQCQFLRHIVEAAIDGRTGDLGQYSIGLDVFDRGEDFDPGSDSIVRVEAGRLRSKLTEYYATAGARDRIIIDLPRGGYTPSISEREMGSEIPGQRPGGPPERRKSRPYVLLMVLAVISAGIALLLWTVFSGTTDDGVQRIPEQGQTSIAVLPFDNMSADPDQEYFSDGISEDIITDLSVISDLRVIARHSTFVYKGQSVGIREIGRELDVHYVLEGSVRRAGGRLRITAQLIEVATEAHVWAERFDRDLSDVFNVQDEVTAQIVKALKIALTDSEAERLSRRNTVNLEAHDFYLRGQERFWHLDAAGVTEAIALFQRAMDADAEYAEAYAWKSRALTFAFISGIIPSKRETVDPAMSLARAAIEIDGGLPMAHANLAWALRWNASLAEAVDAVEVAIRLDPNFADALLWKSMILSAANDGQGALDAINRAIALNPNYSVTYTLALGRAYVALGDYETALSHFQRTTERNPNFLPGLIHEAFALERLKMPEAAAAAFSRIEAAHPFYRQSATYRFFLLEWPE